MPRNRDLFDDSTMTFGEHLEVLRVHVWKALVGLVIGVIAALFFGDKIIGVLRQPIDDALRRNNEPVAEDDIGGMDFKGFMEQLFSDEEEEEEEEEVPEVVEEPEIAEDELVVEVPLASLRSAIKAAVPGIVIDVPQPDESEPGVADPEPRTGQSQVPTDQNDATTDEGDAVADEDDAVADEDDAVADESDAAADEGDAVADDEISVSLVLRSEEIALFKRTADRFNRPVTYKVEEAFMTYIKISLVSGFVLTSPWVFYQIWLFVAAGLFPNERKHVYIYLPMSLGLFLLGAVFCYLFVFPIVLNFLISFNKWLGIEIQPRLSEYISLALMLPVMFGISFQLPLVMLFLERIGIVTIKAYSENWRMAVLVISIASMLLTPADPSSMLLMMFPLVILYIVGIQLCKFRPSAPPDPLA
ncbi:MAG: twin-arginine translocase subunit TatC [Fuerstiella sp.]|nr:twin-arginine translocase subunit TatC [Fuerstiella sp.]